ncbi:MAG: DNA ligase D [Rhodospirillales bacterium]|nr:DNA ligase D [Rhodospirillales bacterium]
MPDALEIYRRKRRFDRTPEPAGKPAVAAGDAFVIHKHAARRLHYDLRLQFGDVLKSWAVTRGPSLDPADRRLAVHVEDHPFDYGSFEGRIPKGEYGAGGVIVWDRGRWVAMGDPEDDYRRGALKFRLLGEKLLGGWTLVRLKRREGERDNWLLIKERDEFARPGDGDALLREAPESVVSGHTLETLPPADPAKEPAAGAVRKPRTGGSVRGIEFDDAPAAALPDFVAPQLATLAEKPPDGDGWLHEIKFDGYRALVRVDAGDVRIFTRNGHDWTARYGDLPDAFARLGDRRLLLDGEIVVQDDDGVSSFAALQEALARGRPQTLLFYAFDLLHLDGHDLQRIPLLRRKEALAAVLAALADGPAPVLLSDHILGRGAAFAGEACRMGLEGIVSKRIDAPYRSGRTRTWLKSKCVAGDDFVIVGFTETKAAGGLAALLLASHGDEGLAYAGRAGSGISRQEAERLDAALRPLIRPTPALRVPPATAGETVRWVEPSLVAEINFANRTGDGLLRQARYKGLRPDLAAAEAGSPQRGGKAAGKDAAAVPTTAVSPPEPPQPPPKPVVKPRLVSDADLATIWVTNPERSMFGRDGATKLDLALYYARVGDWMLPEITNRPVSLVRCPTGEASACFYQRHAGAGMPPSIKRIALREERAGKRADFVYLDDARGLLGLAQFGVVEFHPWGCRVDRPERPDRMIFDLDPDESVRWREVVAAAFDIRAVLEAIGLAVFVKTTGGKGLHLVVPLARRQSWSGVRDFSAAVVKALARREPKRFTASLSLASRKGKIFIDYLRNGRGATAVAAYSLRARAGLPVATPVDWQELDGLDDPAALNFRTVPERLAGLLADPWAGMDDGAKAVDASRLRKLETICPPPQGR